MRRLIFLIAGSLFAQDATFKTSVNLVVVNVSVKDGKGNLITNLKKDDFEIYEDGVKQPLTLFTLQKLNNDLLPPIEVAASGAPRTIEEKVAPKPAAAAPAATPNNPIRFQDRRLLALFFDNSSMQPFEQIRAQEAAIKFLNAQMTSSDVVEIMTFSTRFKVVQDFTDDRETLISTLKKMMVGEGSDLAGLAATAADEGDDTGTFTADETEFNVFNTDMKLSALEDACKKLSVYPEKKALVYFSSGVNKTGIENQAQLKATVNAAVRANLSFYTVDARGLMAEAPGGDASVASSKGTGVFSGTSQAGRKSNFNDSQETLYSLAADTGGKALLDSNDLTMGIRKAQEDIGTYYVLGYNSANSSLDGKYRRITVKMINKTVQAKLDYKNGYYASKVWGKMSASDKERQLEEALTLGDPVSELPLALEIDYFRVAKDRYFVPISVKIPGSAINTLKHGDKQSVTMDFIGQVRDSSTKLVGGVRDAITVKFDEANAAQLAKHNLQYDAGLPPLGPGTYTLKFLAREDISGKMGTFDAKFTIPDLNTAKTLRVSSVVWSSQKDPVTSAVGSAENNKKTLAAHPLIQNGQQLVPSITHVFRKDQTLYVYFEVYDPSIDPERKTPSLAAQVELLQGSKRFVSDPVRLNKLGTARPGVAPFSFQIPLAKFAPGQYLSQVNVIDELGHKFAFPRGEIVLIP